MNSDMTTVSISFPGGQQRNFPAGVRTEEVLQAEELRGGSPIVAARVNKALTSLTYRIEINSSVEPVLLGSREGATIYRRSLCFLLTIAAKQLFSDRRLVIGHSLGRGYFYYFDGMQSVDERDLHRLSARMREIVAADLPIQRRVISYSEAVEYFRANNQPDTVLLPSM